MILKAFIGIIVFNFVLFFGSKIFVHFISYFTLFLSFFLFFSVIQYLDLNEILSQISVLFLEFTHYSLDIFTTVD